MSTGAWILVLVCAVFVCLVAGFWAGYKDGFRDGEMEAHS